MQRGEIGADRITMDFIRAMPKTDLHLHLDGSLRLSTLIDMAKRARIELPSYTEEGLKDLVFKEKYANLVDYLQGFKYTTAVLQNEENLEQVAYELALDNIEEGVRYIEVRFAPQLHINQNLSMLDICKSVHMGLMKAEKHENSSPAVRSGKIPPFKYGIILCAMRMFDGEHSQYYDKLLHVHTYSPLRTVYAMASIDLARAAVRMRDENGIPIVGFDLAGREAGYPAEHHKEAYDYAHKHFLKKTVHAGEAYGAESIFQAITDLKADRIGHGYYLMNTEMIQDPDILDKRKYIRDLSQYIADRRITIEVCLTSNIQTNPAISNIAAHAFARMWQEKLSMTFCTDNRLVSRTSVSNEIALAVKAFQLSLHDLRNIIIYGFKRSFYPGTYIEKRQYVHDIINYYERNETEFFPELKSNSTDGTESDLAKEMLDIEP